MARASPVRKLVDEALHILVVDDDRRIRELIKSYLVENGFLVSVAGTAAEARERMRGLTFDLLVLDSTSFYHKLSLSKMEFEDPPYICIVLSVS